MNRTLPPFGMIMFFVIMMDSFNGWQYVKAYESGYFIVGILITWLSFMAWTEVNLAEKKE